MTRQIKSEDQEVKLPIPMGNYKVIPIEAITHERGFTVKFLIVEGSLKGRYLFYPSNIGHLNFEVTDDQYIK